MAMQFLFRVSSKGGYKKATQHPWPCLVFALPFLALYEGGLLSLGGTQAQELRTGAESWLHWVLQGVGLQQFYWTPAFILVVLGGRAWLARKDRPGDMIGLCTGMMVESLTFALALCGLSRGLSALLEHYRGLLAVPSSTEGTLKQIVTYLGAGVYEEVVFRLFLFTAALWLFNQIRMGGKLGLCLAALTSALMFALAHHLGPHGEPFDAYAFLFRSLAGVYFAFLFRWRGFGIVAGTHALYDVIVGILAT